MNNYRLTESICQSIAAKFETKKDIKVCIDKFDAEGNFIEHIMIDGSILQWELENRSFCPEFTYYIENHELYSRAFNRQNKSVFLLRNAVIDIDAKDHHGAGDLTEAKKALAELMLNNLRIKPTMLVLTGRGVQVWYNIEETSRLLEWLYMEALHALFDDARRVLEDSELSEIFEIDKRTEQFSKNFRLPGTYHNGAKVFTSIYYDSEIEYNLNDLPKQRTKQRKTETKQNKVETTTDRKQTAIKRVRVIDENAKHKNERSANFKNLLEYRARAIENAINMGLVSEARHNREIAMFLYYNNLISDLSNEEPEAQTIAINKTIDVPLRREELDSDVFAIKHAYTEITQKTFFEMLGLKGKELNEVKDMTKSKKGSNFKRDRERAIRKATRNAEVILMRERGLSIRAIADAMQISTKTVQTILNKEKVKALAEA